MSDLCQCIIVEATFPLPAGKRLVDRPPCRPNPGTSAVIDRCFDDKWKWGIVEHFPGPWTSGVMYYYHKRER